MKFVKKKNKTKQKKKKHLNKGVIMSSDNDIEFMLATGQFQITVSVRIVYMKRKSGRI